jgi:hypothetical protein
MKLLLFRSVASVRHGEPVVLVRKIWPNDQMCSDQMAHKTVVWSISIADCGLVTQSAKRIAHSVRRQEIGVNCGFWIW